MRRQLTNRTTEVERALKEKDKLKRKNEKYQGLSEKMLDQLEAKDRQLEQWSLRSQSVEMDMIERERAKWVELLAEKDRELADMKEQLSEAH